VFSKSENTSDLFPILVDHTYRDCLAGVRPKLKLYKSLDQAKAAIDQLQEKLYPQLKASSNTQDPSMTSISEISELDEGVGFSIEIYLPKDFIFDFLLWQATDEDSGSSNDQRERQVAGQEPEPEQSNELPTIDHLKVIIPHRNCAQSSLPALQKIQLASRSNFKT